ncbi:MAG: bis(5'-nucleosyl)-tetraphosphatase (symmetrical) YqeK [Candidatus Caenarcaniphilales bacterium]|nr:bis(5'-nucleosyl)-tetraphosphatase (symmetrical) YqeK [Candidatus Caenarcaniphilales bacterium]
MNTLEFIDKIKNHLKSNLSARRFVHIQGVAKTARELANQHGVNEDQAEIAGWLHDIAKEFNNQELINKANEEGLELIEEEKDSPHLLHAKIGAIVARELFQIEDPVILSAIAQHTLGKPNMNRLEEIIFIADSIEPSRPEVWREGIIKSLEEKGFEGAIVTCCQQTLKEILVKKATIHPLTIHTYNYYVNKVSKGL